MSFFLRSAPYLTERIRDVDPLTHTRIYVVPSTLKAGVVRHLTWGILGKTNILQRKELDDMADCFEAAPISSSFAFNF